MTKLPQKQRKSQKKWVRCHQTQLSPRTLIFLLVPLAVDRNRDCDLTRRGLSPSPSMMLMRLQVQDQAGRSGNINKSFNWRSHNEGTSPKKRSKLCNNVRLPAMLRLALYGTWVRAVRTSNRLACCLFQTLTGKCSRGSHLLQTEHPSSAFRSTPRYSQTASFRLTRLPRHPFKHVPLMLSQLFVAALKSRWYLGWRWSIRDRYTRSSALNDWGKTPQFLHYRNASTGTSGG